MPVSVFTEKPEIVLSTLFTTYSKPTAWVERQAEGMAHSNLRNGHQRAVIDVESRNRTGASFEYRVPDHFIDFASAFKSSELPERPVISGLSDPSPPERSNERLRHPGTELALVLDVLLGHGYTCSFPVAACITNLAMAYTVVRRKGTKRRR